MDLSQIKYLISSIFLILVAGIADAQGFLHASKAWNEGQLVGSELAKSILGFTCSISMYLFTVRYLQKIGVVAAELQLIIWFAITIIGVATISGKLIHWPMSDKIVAVGVLIGVCWLIVRTKAA